MGQHTKFDYFRSLYASIDTNEYTPYPIDWIPFFSPIESAAWGEIRCLSLPFWPQFPIGKFFADFADPIKKIVIECDGKDFHSKEKDAPRDAFMISNGWTVYRISGADCNRVVAAPWEEIIDREVDRDSDEAKSIVNNWMSRTIDGLVYAIAVCHYGVKPSDEYIFGMACDTLADRKARGF